MIEGSEQEVETLAYGMSFDSDENPQRRKVGKRELDFSYQGGILMGALKGLKIEDRHGRHGFYNPIQNQVSIREDQVAILKFSSSPFQAEYLSSPYQRFGSRMWKNRLIENKDVMVTDVDDNIDRKNYDYQIYDKKSIPLLRLRIKVLKFMKIWKIKIQKLKIWDPSLFRETLLISVYLNKIISMIGIDLKIHIFPK